MTRDMAGSCALAVVLRGKELFCGNAGDSHAIVFRAKGTKVRPPQCATVPCPHLSLSTVICVPSCSRPCPLRPCHARSFSSAPHAIRRMTSTQSFACPLHSQSAFVSSRSGLTRRTRRNGPELKLPVRVVSGMSLMGLASMKFGSVGVRFPWATSCARTRGAGPRHMSCHFGVAGFFPLPITMLKRVSGMCRRVSACTRRRRDSRRRQRVWCVVPDTRVRRHGRQSRRQARHHLHPCWSAHACSLCTHPYVFHWHTLPAHTTMPPNLTSSACVPFAHTLMRFIGTHHHAPKPHIVCCWSAHVCSLCTHPYVFHWHTPACPQTSHHLYSCWSVQACLLCHSPLRTR